MKEMTEAAPEFSPMLKSFLGWNRTSKKQSERVATSVRMAMQLSTMSD